MRSSTAVPCGTLTKEVAVTLPDSHRVPGGGSLTHRHHAKHRVYSPRAVRFFSIPLFSLCLLFLTVGGIARLYHTAGLAATWAWFKKTRIRVTVGRRDREETD